VDPLREDLPPSPTRWDQLERWFNDPTYRRIRRGTFPSERARIDTLRLRIERYREVPRPFQWRSTPDEVLVNVTRNRSNVGPAGAAHYRSISSLPPVTISSSFWTVFQLRAVPLVPRDRSIRPRVSFERPIPSGYTM